MYGGKREVPQIAVFSAQNSGGGQASRNFRVYLAYEWRIFPLDACYLAYRWRIWGFAERYFAYRWRRLYVIKVLEGMIYTL